jgi:hypothetical protein
VRNTGRRVPTSGGDQAALPPRAVATEPTAVPSTPATPKQARSSHGRVNGIATHSSARALEGEQRHGGALDKLAKDPMHGLSSHDGPATVGATPQAGRMSRGQVGRERTDDAMHRTGGSSSWQHPSLGHVPSQAEIANGLQQNSESFQNLHHSTHGRSASQVVNTISTIDSMLVAGQQNVQAGVVKESEVAGTEELAHANAIAHLEVPNMGDSRRHAEVRVFDINTDGPPKGIPVDWEEGLLEGRKRPANLARPSDAGSPALVAASPPAAVPTPAARHTVAAGLVQEGERDKSKNAARLQAAQLAAEQSVEQAKKRAARAKMVSRMSLIV